MKRNKFSKALKHLKSKKIDEKIKGLEEAAPTNSMSGVYQVTPSTGDAFRMGELDPAKKFYPKADGTWPAGVPADPTDRVYVRGAGYHTGKGALPDKQTITPRDFSIAHMNANGNDTSTMIRPSDGMVYSDLPEGTRNFILGPLVTSYNQNHTYDDFTNLGYIQKDTRQFVLLAQIQGFLDGTKRLGGAARTWDGTATQFVSYNSNFTLEHALWMRDTYNKGDFTANVPFHLSGGVPADRHPDDPGLGTGDGLGTGGANEGGDDDDSGKNQDPPDENDIETLELWGLTADEANEKYGHLSDDELARLGIVRNPDGSLREMTEEEKRELEKKKEEERKLRELQNLARMYDNSMLSDIKYAELVITGIAVWSMVGYVSALIAAGYASREIEKLLNEAVATVNSTVDIFDQQDIADIGNIQTSILKIEGDLVSDEKVGGMSDAEWDDLRAKQNDKENDALKRVTDKLQKAQNGGRKKVEKAAEKALKKLRDIKAKNKKRRQQITKLRKQAQTLADEAKAAYREMKRLGIKNVKDAPPHLREKIQNLSNALSRKNVSGEVNRQYLKRHFPKGPGGEFGSHFDIKSTNWQPGGGDSGLNMDYQPRGTILQEDKKRILREIRQPLKEIKELPKTTKLKGYRPNFKGKFSPQNTPDVTASKKSDDIVSAKNSSRQIWTAKDKFWKGYETTERMNIIYDNLGHGSQYFDRIVGENVRQKNKKSREVQEHLNMLAHQKAMREVYGIKEYEQIIDESETFDNKINDPLFTKVAKRLKKEIDYSKKPAAKGYPDKAPPKIDPNTGMHPKFGKRYKYDKLDPISAKTMAGAPTGDPEIDANVKKAAKIKEDWRSDLKNLWLGSERKEWKKKIEEDYVNTTQGMKVGQTFTHVPSGETVTTSGVLGGIETLQTSVPIFGDEIPGPNASQYGLQGFAKPIDIMRRGSTKKAEKLNKELDSSEEYTKEVKADEFMKARVTGELSLEQKKEFVEIYKNNIEEWNKKSEVRARENERRRKSNVSKVRSFVRKFGANLDKIKGVQTFMKITQGGKKLVVIHQNNMFRDLSNKFNVRVYEAEKGKKISKLTGNFGRVDSSMFDNPFTNRKSSGEATIMYDGVGGEVESKTFAIKELPPIPMPTPPKFMQKNMDKGWQPSATSSFDQEFINKMNTWFNTIPTGGANFPAKLAINLAKGNLDPVTNSPGPAITNLIKQNILDNLKKGNSKSDKLGTNSYWDSKSGKGAIRYDMYKFGDSIQAAKMAPVSASLGQYSIERTDKGIRIVDTYDISGGFTSPGGAAIFDPLTKLIGGRDVQSTGETLTAIAARRAAELGYDMVDADSGKTLRPVYSGEEEFNSRNYPNSGAPTIATPKGFNIKIDFTIPWDSFSPETATLLKIGGKEKVDPLSNNKSKQVVSKEPSKAVQKIKSMSKTKRQSLSLDEPIVKRKNKKS